MIVLSKSRETAQASLGAFYGTVPYRHTAAVRTEDESTAGRTTRGSLHKDNQQDAL